MDAIYRTSSETAQGAQTRPQRKPVSKAVSLSREPPCRWRLLLPEYFPGTQDVRRWESNDSTFIHSEPKDEGIQLRRLWMAIDVG